MKPTLEITSSRSNALYVDIHMIEIDEFIQRDILNIFPESNEFQHKIRTRINDLFKQWDNIDYIRETKGVTVNIEPCVEKKIKKFQLKNVPDNKNRKLANIQLINSALKEAGFSRVLKSYQEKNLQEIMNLNGVALFSVPGSGKTTEALAYYYCNRENNSKLLIVSPKNAFGAWEEQLNKCVENPEFQIHRLARHNLEDIKTYKACILTYQSLINLEEGIANWLSGEGEHFIILDESHKIKNGGSQSTQSALSLSHLAQRCIIMSGTPMPQDKNDLITQLEFLYPNSNTNDSNKAVDLMKRFFVRTTKKDLKLPELTFKITILTPSEKQNKIQDLVRKSNLFVNQNANTIEEIRALRRNCMKLLQLASNPKLLINQNTMEIEPLNTILNELKLSDIPKVQYAVNKARQLVNEGRRVLIWSIFKENIRFITEQLQDVGSDFIHGDVKVGDKNDPSTREGKIKRFREGNIKVLIANPASCSEGISLHEHCHDAIYVDRSFNLAHYLQSVDRIHRVGLPPDIITNIEVLMCEGTIDANVNLRLYLKEERMNQFLNNKDIVVSGEKGKEYEERDIEEYESAERDINKYSSDFDEEDAKTVKKYLLKNNFKIK